MPSNEAGKQLNPTGATSLAGETPRKRLSSTDLSGREVGGLEGVQLISAERRNISGNFCAQEAQEDRTLPSGLCLLELRLFPDKSQNNLSGEPTSCGQNPHSWESFHSSSDPTMDALCPALIPLSQLVLSLSVSIKSQLSQDSRTGASLFSLSFLKRKKKKKAT